MDRADRYGRLMDIVDGALSAAEAEGDRFVVFTFGGHTKCYTHTRAANLIQALHVRILRAEGR